MKDFKKFTLYDNTETTATSNTNPINMKIEEAIKLVDAQGCFNNKQLDAFKRHFERLIELESLLEEQAKEWYKKGFIDGGNSYLHFEDENHTPEPMSEEDYHKAIMQEFEDNYLNQKKDED